jgi:hypothetical protein
MKTLDLHETLKKIMKNKYVLLVLLLGLVLIILPTGSSEKAKAIPYPNPSRPLLFHL